MAVDVGTLIPQCIGNGNLIPLENRFSVPGCGCETPIPHCRQRGLIEQRVAAGFPHEDLAGAAVGLYQYPQHNSALLIVAARHQRVIGLAVAGRVGCGNRDSGAGGRRRSLGGGRRRCSLRVTGRRAWGQTWRATGRCRWRRCHDRWRRRCGWLGRMVERMRSRFLPGSRRPGLAFLSRHRQRWFAGLGRWRKFWWCDGGSRGSRGNCRCGWSRSVPQGDDQNRIALPG